MRLNEEKDLTHQDKVKIKQDLKLFLQPVREKLLQFEQELKDRWKKPLTIMILLPFFCTWSLFIRLFKCVYLNVNFCQGKRIFWSLLSKSFKTNMLLDYGLWTLGPRQAGYVLPFVMSLVFRRLSWGVRTLDHWSLKHDYVRMRVSSSNFWLFWVMGIFGRYMAWFLTFW